MHAHPASECLSNGLAARRYREPLHDPVAQETDVKSAKQRKTTFAMFNKNSDKATMNMMGTSGSKRYKGIESKSAADGLCLPRKSNLLLKEASESVLMFQGDIEDSVFTRLQQFLRDEKDEMSICGLGKRDISRVLGKTWFNDDVITWALKLVSSNVTGGEYADYETFFGVFPKCGTPAIIFNSIWVAQFWEDESLNDVKLKRWLQRSDVPWHQIEIFHFAVNKDNNHFFLASACKHDSKVIIRDSIRAELLENDGFYQKVYHVILAIVSKAMELAGFPAGLRLDASLWQLVVCRDHPQQWDSKNPKKKDNHSCGPATVHTVYVQITGEKKENEVADFVSVRKHLAHILLNSLHVCADSGQAGEKSASCETEHCEHHEVVDAATKEASCDARQVPQAGMVVETGTNEVSKISELNFSKKAGAKKHPSDSRILCNPVPYGHVDGILQIDCACGRGTQTRSVTISADVHSVQGHGSCLLICAAISCLEANQDQHFKDNLKRLKDPELLKNWSELCQCSMEVTGPQADWSCQSLRRLFAKYILMNSKKFIDVFAKQHPTQIIRPREMSLQYNRLCKAIKVEKGIDVPKECELGPDQFHVAKWAVAFLSPTTWCEEWFVHVFVDFLKKRIAICQLRVSKECPNVAKYLSVHLSQDAEIAFLVLHHDSLDLDEWANTNHFDALKGAIFFLDHEKEGERKKKTIDAYFPASAKVPGPVVTNDPAHDPHHDMPLLSCNEDQALNDNSKIQSEKQVVLNDNSRLQSEIQVGKNRQYIVEQGKEWAKRLVSHKQKSKNRYPQKKEDTRNFEFFLIKCLEMVMRDDASLNQVLEIVQSLLISAIDEGETPFLHPMILGTLVGLHPALNSGCLSRVCHLHSQSAMASFPDSALAPFNSETGGRIKIAFLLGDISKPDSIPSILAGQIEKILLFDVYIFLRCPRPETGDPPLLDMLNVFEARNRLIPNVAHLNRKDLCWRHSIFATCDLSIGSNNEFLAERNTPVNLVFSPSGDLLHHNSRLVDYTLGVKSDDVQHTNYQGCRETTVHFGSSLPMPLHPYFRDDIPKRSREHFDLPATGFLLCYPSADAQISRRQLHDWITLAGNVDGSYLVLFPKKDMISAIINEVFELSKLTSFDTSRVRILPCLRHQFPEHLARLMVMDLLLDSSGTAEALIARKPVLCLCNPSSNTLSRAAAHLMRENGLGNFVHAGVLDYLRYGESFAKSKSGPSDVVSHYSALRVFHDENWSNCFQAAIKAAIDQFQANRTSLRRIDLSVMDSVHKTPVFQNKDDMIFTAIMNAIPNRFKTELTEDSQLAIIAVVKAIQDSGNQVVGLCGVGGRTITLDCIESDGSKFAAKIDSISVAPNQLEESQLYREVMNTVLLKNTEFIAKPRSIFKFKRQSNCFFGTTLPNSKGKCHVFYTCEHLDCVKATDFISRHTSAWRDTGIFTEELRLQLLVPLLGAIGFLNSKGMCILDVKPGNVGIDSNGRFKFSDLGHSVLQRKHNPGFPQEPSVATLRASYLNPPISMGGEKLATVIAFSESDLRKRNSEYMGKNGVLKCMGIGTNTYYNDSSDGLRNSKDTVISAVAGSLEDFHQTAMTICQIFHPADGNDYVKRVRAASSSVSEMMKFMQPAECSVKQPVAFQRVASLLVDMLGDSVQRREQIQRHKALTLLVLEPFKETLASGDGIPFEGGKVQNLHADVKRVKKWQNEEIIPIKLKFFGKKGLGVRAGKCVVGKQIIGWYAGAYIKSSYHLLSPHSRYVVSCIGCKAAGNCEKSDLFYGDAAPSEILTLDWFIEKSAWGHFMNAADSAKNANCTVDRRDGWVDDNGIIWFPIWSKASGLKEGEELVWVYPEEASGRSQ